jgi:large subunit ribosomal protein L22
METKAQAKYIRIAPRKVQVIVPAIKGKKVGEAISLLQFMPRKGARILKKVIHSAVANAEQNKVDIDTLIVKKVLVDFGPTLKRFMPRAMGRATPILKRTSHITVYLDEIGK